MEKFITKVTNLIEVKKIIAIIIVIVFCFLSIKEIVAVEQFTTIATIIISFYFGQSVAKNNK